MLEKVGTNRVTGAKGGTNFGGKGGTNNRLTDFGRNSALRF